MSRALKDSSNHSRCRPKCSRHKSSVWTPGQAQGSNPSRLPVWPGAHDLSSLVLGLLYCERGVTEVRAGWL